MGFAEWFVLALTILFLAYFAYAAPIIMVGIWHYKKHGFGDDDPGDDWDPFPAACSDDRVEPRLLRNNAVVDQPMMVPA